MKRMVNEQFEPDENQEAILNILKEGRETGQPWGYANPKRLQTQLEIRKQYINRSLRSLVDAGWVEKVNRGLYRFVADPRESE
jgi:DNA-binding MarR family transcriptional regulator